MKTHNIKKGQMLELSVRDDNSATCEFVVAIQVFDDRVLFAKEYGESYMHVFHEDEDESVNKERELLANQKVNRLLVGLYIDGEPVFSKRWLGKYTFKPKSKSKSNRNK